MTYAVFFNLNPNTNFVLWPFLSRFDRRKCVLPLVKKGITDCRKGPRAKERLFCTTCCVGCVPPPRQSCLFQEVQWSTEGPWRWASRGARWRADSWARGAPRRSTCWRGSPEAPPTSCPSSPSTMGRRECTTRVWSGS